MTFRKATEQDLQAIAEIYADVHTEEELGHTSTGWMREIYPTPRTAALALARDDLFVQEEDGQIVGTAIINQQQVDVYAGAPWEFAAADSEVMVLHTLVISPKAAGKGCGKAFVRFYEEYALAHNCHFLRIDTNARNARARAMYHKLGFKEIDIVPCAFNGIAGVQLVLLEKAL